MTETIRPPELSRLRGRVRPDRLARLLLRMRLTRAYDGVPLTKHDRLAEREVHRLISRPGSERHFARRQVSAAELQISALYRALAELDMLPSTPAREADRARKVAELRKLQHAEADRADRWFKTHREFDPKTAREAMRRAEGLIARHARPS